jgi:hypothetical protein
VLGQVVPDGALPASGDVCPELFTQQPLLLYLQSHNVSVLKLGALVHDSTNQNSFLPQFVAATKGSTAAKSVRLEKKNMSQAIFVKLKEEL